MDKKALIKFENTQVAPEKLNRLNFLVQPKINQQSFKPIPDSLKAFESTWSLGAPVTSMKPNRINRYLLLLFFCHFLFACLLRSDSPGLTGLSGNDSFVTCLPPSDRPGSFCLESSFSDLFLLID